ncbi:phosphatase PAP2 family protein [Streptomyces sp. DSM 41699]|uniref:Phosphatase PAP2 family protein n=1 Tax=Streptomyces gibsoniae TaxID=3075529 RepID=A0ABU2U2E7_9ACTN|nr:phosphatase PAP2 family protein [Streptomyces sp. DSM 41699]MDT0467404.1 phosphatase PAP2 family protein [Streptomyces sp. DSM 41699]
MLLRHAALHRHHRRSGLALRPSSRPLPLGADRAVHGHSAGPAGFAFCATAPPRFLAGQGYIDTVVAHHTWGSWASGDVASLSNQYAAMPSVHIIWSAWSGLTLVFLARHAWVRALGACHPLATFTVILATANHFVTDAAAGAATLALGFLTQRLLTGRVAYHKGIRRPDSQSALTPPGA